MISEKTKKPRKRLSQSSGNYECDFCSKKFKKASTYTSHLEKCMVLERLMQMEEEPILYYIWQKISYIRKSEFEEKVKFSRSSLYKPIYEFLTRIKRVRWNFLPDYVEWLLNNNVSFKKWEDYKIYQQFVKHKINSELPREAIERSLVYIDSVS